MEQRSIKEPLIMALYSLLLDVNFNLQSLIQFPSSGVAGSALKGQDNEGRGTKSLQAGTGGVWRGSPGIPFFCSLLSLCLHRAFDCPDGGAFKLYWRRGWHFPAALKKKEKKIRKEEENCWLIMSGPRGNNYHVNWGRVNSEEIRTRLPGLLPASFHSLGDDSCQFWGHRHCQLCRGGQVWSHRSCR